MNFRISIILVEPENPDNIGAVARAMKNMGLGNLRLVNPPEEWRQKAKKMAIAAEDVLKKALVYPTLREAVSDQTLVIGTTRRHGPRRGVFIPFQEMIKKVQAVAQRKPAAIIFGKESKGLDNASLKLCDWVTTLPASPAYPSINLAQAVMLVAFALFQSDHKEKIPPSSDLLYVSKEVMDDVLARLRKSLHVLNYEEEGSDVIDRILATFHGLFKRGGLIQSEAQMLRGIARRICESRQNEAN